MRLHVLNGDTMFRHRRFRKFPVRRVRGTMMRAGWVPPAKRIAAIRPTTFTGSNVAATETITTLFTGTDDPTGKQQIETGGKIKTLWLELKPQGSITGQLTEFLVYVNSRGNAVPSTTPIADYVNSTYSITRNTADVTRHKLWYKHLVVRSGDTSSQRIVMKKHFKKGIMLGDNSTILLSHRSDGPTSAPIWYIRAYARYYK